MTASRRLAAAIALLVAGALLGAALAAGAGSSAHAQQPASAAKTVSANGIGQVAVKPRDRHNNASIVAAVEAAEAKAVPQAVTAARERAADLAKAAGLTIGAVQSVAETQPSPFGKDKYCGDERRPRVVRDANGRRRVVGTRKVHVCRVPPFVVVNLSVTFAAS